MNEPRDLARENMSLVWSFEFEGAFATSSMYRADCRNSMDKTDPLLTIGGTWNLCLRLVLNGSHSYLDGQIYLLPSRFRVRKQVHVLVNRCLLLVEEVPALVMTVSLVVILSCCRKQLLAVRLSSSNQLERNRVDSGKSRLFWPSLTSISRFS
jgi:hypothetical protein